MPNLCFHCRVQLSRSTTGRWSTQLPQETGSDGSTSLGNHTVRKREVSEKKIKEKYSKWTKHT